MLPYQAVIVKNHKEQQLGSNIRFPIGDGFKEKKSQRGKYVDKVFHVRSSGAKLDKVCQWEKHWNLLPNCVTPHTTVLHFQSMKLDYRKKTVMLLVLFHFYELAFVAVTGRL